MAKTSQIEKNDRRKALAKQYGKRRAALKKTMMDRDATPEERFEAQLKLQKLPRNSAPARFKNRCQVSGRSKAVYRKFKLSRIALRDLASTGQLPGVIKASW